MTNLLIGLIGVALMLTWWSQHIDRDYRYGWWETFLLLLGVLAIFSLPVETALYFYRNQDAPTFDVLKWDDWSIFLYGCAVGGGVVAVVYVVRTYPYLQNLRTVSVAKDFLIRDGELRSGVRALSRGRLQEAREQFQTLAAQGNPRAMNNLGVLYESGVGVPQDKQEALNWYRRASEAGIPMAKHNLAVLLAGDHLLPFSGADTRSKEEDFIEAYALFVSAARDGLSISKRGLRDLKKHMSQEQIDRAEQRCR